MLDRPQNSVRIIEQGSRDFEEMELKRTTNETPQIKPQAPSCCAQFCSYCQQYNNSTAEETYPLYFAILLRLFKGDNSVLSRCPSLTHVIAANACVWLVQPWLLKKKRPLGTVQHVLDTHGQALHIACIIDFKQANIFGCVCI